MDAAGLAAVVWLCAVPLSLWIAYLMIRGAVRAGVKRAIRDTLTDPVMRFHMIDLIRHDLAEPDRADDGR